MWLKLGEISSTSSKFTENTQLKEKLFTNVSTETVSSITSSQQNM